ncbi:hypothetical protein K440DRAFT_672084 [Wilcoxina mikolae CBS 423.85]|nr:hypothetical protein K440DRAFT_672084 [Wilcoxina mikolae CBS 423.85]
MEVPSTKSLLPLAQTPPHRRTVSGLTDPFVSKPTDPKPTIPPTMRVPKTTGHDVHLDSGSVAGTICESEVPQRRQRMKWQDEPPRDGADKARRAKLAKKIEDLQLALANFDAEAEERKKKIAKENQERLRQFNEQNKGRLARSDLESLIKEEAQSRCRSKEIVTTFIKYGRHNLQPYNEDSDCEGSASTDHDLGLTPGTPVAIQESQSMAHQILPHSGDTDTPKIGDKDTLGKAQVPPHLRVTAPTPQSVSKEFVSGILHGGQVSTQKAEPDKVPTHQLEPPHPRMNRNITDPSKIVHVKDTPPAPPRRPQMRNIEASKTSPTPRHQASPPVVSVSSEDGEEETKEDSGGEWVKSVARAESPSPSGTHTPAVSAAHTPAAGVRHPIGKGPTVSRGKGPTISGAAVPKTEVHIVPSLGIEITTSTCPLPEGHHKPWVRNVRRPIKIADPPPAYLVRSLVPASYKDSALNPKERADAFNERLKDIEKMTGLSGRYPGERGYDRGRGNRHHQVGQGFGNRRRPNAPPEMRRRDAPVSVRPGRPNDRGYHRQQQNLARNETQRLIDAGQGPRRPVIPTTLVQDTDLASPDIPDFDFSSQMSPPTPLLDLVTERRIVFLESISPTVSIAHILRALGNTGRIEELELGENYQGTFATLKFVNEETAAIFATRENLIVPISLGNVVTLPIFYAQPTQLLRSEVAVFGRNESRVLHVGPCPDNYFVNAYLEYMHEDAQMKPTIVDYIWEMMETMCVTWPNHFLDVSLETRGTVLKAIVSFTSIKAALEVAETCKSLEALQGVKVSFGRDPCQGNEECDRLGIKSEEQEEKERQKKIDDERNRMKAEYYRQKKSKQAQKEGSEWMKNDDTDLVRAYEQADKEKAEARR